MMACDQQELCALLNVPLELRHQIYHNILPYGVHVSARHDTFVLSTCIQSSPNASMSGTERSGLKCLFPLGQDDPLYAPRLRSTRGPHWECEEMALKVNHSVEEIRQTCLDMLHMCKKMRADFLAFLAEVATIHVTSLETLEQLLSPKTPRVPDDVTTALNSMKALSITLRLRRPMFAEFERSIDQAPLRPLTAWLETCAAIPNLQRLRKLHLWADHAGTSSWTLVNERAFLLPLHALAKNPAIRISVNLPKLYPKYETPERHFLPGSDTPPFTITRRLRQAWHGVRYKYGKSGARYFRDFPILWDDDSDEEFEDVERMERKMWENGEDVWRELQWRSAIHVYYEDHIPSSDDDGNTSGTWAQ